MIPLIYLSKSCWGIVDKLRESNQTIKQRSIEKSESLVTCFGYAHILISIGIFQIETDMGVVFKGVGIYNRETLE